MSKSIISDNLPAQQKEVLEVSFVTFFPPVDWAEDAFLYYYFNDQFEDSPVAWPGTKMYWDNTSTFSIMGRIEFDEMHSGGCRVIITDGVHRYPKEGEPGILLSSEHNLIIEKDRYFYRTKSLLTVNQQTNLVRNGQLAEAVIRNTTEDPELTVGLYFFDFKGDTIEFDDPSAVRIEPVRVEPAGLEMDTARYFFDLDTPGFRDIGIYFAGQASVHYTCVSHLYFCITEKGSQFDFYSSEYDLLAEEEFSLTVIHPDPSVKSYTLITRKGIKLEPESIDNSESGKLVMKYRSSGLPLYPDQMLRLYEKHDDASLHGTSYFITVNIYDELETDDDDILISTQKPSDWGNKLYLNYYFSNESEEQSRCIEMSVKENTYANYTIEKPRRDCFVFFTDDKGNRFPFSSQTPLKIDRFQQLILEKNHQYLIDNRNWMRALQRTNSIETNGTVALSVIFDKGTERDLIFREYYLAPEIAPVSCTETVTDDRVYRDYYFNHEKDLRIFYKFDNIEINSGREVNLYLDTDYQFRASSYRVLIGEQFTLYTSITDPDAVFTIFDDNKDEWEQIHSYQTTIDNKPMLAIVVKAQEFGLDQKLHLYETLPGRESRDTGCFITVDVWDDMEYTLPVYVRLHMSDKKTGTAFIHYFKNNDLTQENAPWPGEPMTKESYSPSDFTFKMERANSYHVSVTANINNGESLSCKEHVQVLGGDELFFTTHQYKLFYIKKKYNVFDITQVGNDLSFADMESYIGTDMDADINDKNLVFKSSRPLEITKFMKWSDKFHRNYYQYRFHSPRVLADNTQIEVEILQKTNGVEKPTGHVLKLYYCDKMKIVSMGSEVYSETFTMSFYPYRENENYCIQGIYKPLNVTTDGASRLIEFSSEPFLGTQQQIDLYKIEDNHLKLTGFHSLVHFWKPC